MGGRSESSGGDGPDLPLFEYDPNKSDSNKAKHGVDFEQAQTMWRDPNGVNVLTTYQRGERWALLATMAGKVWLVVWTPRGQGTRLISVRRASRREEEIYHGDIEP
jgi:uncharacterized DUF497 family protein